jgi:hypothetical protein
VVDVGAEQAGQQRRQLPGVPQLGQHVEVVGHQAVVVQAQAQLVAVAAEEGEEGGAVVLVGEEGLAVVAAVQDVVAGGLGPGQASGEARHAGSPVSSGGGAGTVGDCSRRGAGGKSNGCFFEGPSR